MKWLSTRVVLVVLVGVYALALLPALFVAGYRQSPIGVLSYMPYLSIYLFDWLGVPWLLVGGGTCGWGWCAPSWFGWVFVGAVWTGLAWGVAWALVRTTNLLIQWRSAREAAGNHPES